MLLLHFWLSCVHLLPVAGCQCRCQPTIAHRPIASANATKLKTFRFHTANPNLFFYFIIMLHIFFFLLFFPIFLLNEFVKVFHFITHQKIQHRVRTTHEYFNLKLSNRSCLWCQRYCCCYHSDDGGGGGNGSCSSGRCSIVSIVFRVIYIIISSSFWYKMCHVKNNFN